MVPILTFFHKTSSLEIGWLLHEVHSCKTLIVASDAICNCGLKTVFERLYHPFLHSLHCRMLRRWYDVLDNIGLHEGTNWGPLSFYKLHGQTCYNLFSNLMTCCLLSKVTSHLVLFSPMTHITTKRPVCVSNSSAVNAVCFHNSMFMIISYHSLLALFAKFRWNAITLLCNADSLELKLHGDMLIWNLQM